MKRSVHLLDLEDDLKAIYVPVRGVMIDEPETFIEQLKAKGVGVDVQAIDARFVANLHHLQAVIKQVWMADKRGMSRARFDLEILLRIAADSRVTNAVATVGLKKGTLDVIFVAVGKEKDLKSLADYLGTLGEVSKSLLQLTQEKEETLQKHHEISDQALESTILKQGSLSGILAEKAAIALFS